MLAYKIQTLGKLPRRKHTAFRTQRKFEIKKNFLCCLGALFNNAVSYTALMIVEQMTVEHWRNDTDRGKHKYLQKNMGILK